VSSLCCNSPRTRGACGAGAARQTQRYGQGIPAGASQSTVPHAHSARASVAQSAGHECPWPPGENLAIDPVTIPNQVFGRAFPLIGLGELAGHPFGIRMGRHAEPSGAGHAKESVSHKVTESRWRSNVWTYPGASSFGSDARRGLEDHPTVKPTAMLVDALHDLINLGTSCSILSRGLARP
jgi:hypothetical protein